MDKYLIEEHVLPYLADRNTFGKLQQKKTIDVAVLCFTDEQAFSKKNFLSLLVKLHTKC